jgi:hypothetical protein
MKAKIHKNGKNVIKRNEDRPPGRPRIPMPAAVFGPSNPSKVRHMYCTRFPVPRHTSGSRVSGSDGAHSYSLSSVNTAGDAAPGAGAGVKKCASARHVWCPTVTARQHVIFKSESARRLGLPGGAEQACGAHTVKLGARRDGLLEVSDGADVADHRVGGRHVVLGHNGARRG